MRASRNEWVSASGRVGLREKLGLGLCLGLAQGLAQCERTRWRTHSWRRRLVLMRSSWDDQMPAVEVKWGQLAMGREGRSHTITLQAQWGAAAGAWGLPNRPAFGPYMVGARNGSLHMLKIRQNDPRLPLPQPAPGEALRTSRPSMRTRPERGQVRLCRGPFSRRRAKRSGQEFPPVLALPMPDRRRAVWG